MHTRLPRHALSIARPIPSSHISRCTPSIPSALDRRRALSTTPTSSEPATATLSSRWLSDVKARIGKCITFGLNPAQTEEASSILQEIALDWRGLVAGSEGFLTDEAHRGLFRQEVVWGEMVGHVNNVVYNKWAESARVNWVLKFANQIDRAHAAAWKELMTPLSTGLILRSIRTDYKFPMKYPDRVTVLHKLRSAPQPSTDHFILDVLILSERHRRPAARCVEDIVVYDYKAARKAPLRPFMVDRFREVWDAQEGAKRTYGGKVEGLMGRVRELERASWDREGAVEDLGAAGR